MPRNARRPRFDPLETAVEDTYEYHRAEAHVLVVTKAHDVEALKRQLEEARKDLRAAMLSAINDYEYTPAEIGHDISWPRQRVHSFLRVDKEPTEPYN